MGEIYPLPILLISIANLALRRAINTQGPQEGRLHGNGAKSLNRNDLGGKIFFVHTVKTEKFFR